MASEMVVCSREANTVSMECEELPPQKHVLDEWTYRKLLRDRTEGGMGLASNIFTHKEQCFPPGASYGFYPSPYGPPSDSDVSFQSNYSSAPQFSIFSGMFRSPKASLMAGSMDRYERFECGELPQGGDGRQHFYHNNGYDEGKQHLLSRGERSEAHYTSQLSSYNQNASYTALSQNGPQDGQDKMVFHNDSALLQKLNHTSQHTHVYSQPPNSKSRMDITTNPMLTAHLNQENGELNYNIGSIHGQSASVSHPTSLNHDNQTKQLTRGNPLSLRNDHLNQQNDMVNESVSAIQEQPMSHTSSFQEISLPSQRGHLSQQNGNMGSHSSQRIVMEVSQCTSLGQAPSGTELRQSQKTRNPMSIRNDRLNQENTFNQGVPPHVVKVPTPVPGYHISLHRDQGDQEPGHVPSATHSQPISDPSQKVNAYGGKSNQGPEDIPFHKHNHEISQGFSHRNMPPDASGQMHKKVFILHFTNTDHSLETNPVLKLATCLRRMDVNVTLDLFEYDNRIDNWLVWYERKINESDVVLCIITENFYDQLTNGNHVLGNSVYNLMNQSRNIAFRAVFIDADKRKMMEHVPPAMRGATSYSLSSNQLTPNDDEFANLYAFLTGQNRVKKPELGNMIILAPKTSRFGNFSGAPAPAYNSSRNMQQQQQGRVMHQPMAPPAPQPAVNPSGGAPNVEQANFIFTLLRADITPIKSVRSHNQMLMQLASKLMVEWEALGRMLNVSEPDIYAIKADNIHSVKEQAVQMFQHWMRKNGSRATLGVLTTAVYDSGAQYWNLLDTINKYALQQ